MWSYYHRDQIHYSHVRGRDWTNQFHPPPYVIQTMDCSGLAIFCYNVAGSPDPTGGNYNGQGWTGSLWPKGKLVGSSVSSVKNFSPGDLVFYANPLSQSGHVVVYVGFYHAVSHGQESGPTLVDLREYRTSEFTGGRTYQV